MADESEIKSWLEAVLESENIDNFSIQISGTTEKGDGYAGDIVFVSLTPVNDKSTKNYNLVLKCSKRSKALRENIPMKDVFLNEIYVYEKVFLEFTKFQLEKGVSDVFKSVPKYYGSVVTEDMEILVFENLRKLGYNLWDKKKPLTRKHLELVLGEYAKFHAVSIAMKDQKPEQFQKLCDGCKNVFDEFVQTIDIGEFFGKAVLEIYDVLRDELDDNILENWKNLKDKVAYIFTELLAEMNGTKVLLHGDCWSNNFMYKNIDNKVLLPVNVSIIDWQISRYSSPILDLSYFLFASISKEDIENLEDILLFYYQSLTEAVKKLGSNLGIIYPKDEFLSDWKKYCKFGISFASLLFKVCSTDKDEVIDMAEAAEEGKNFNKTFDYEIRDKTTFKNRAKHVVKYVVENNLI